MIWSSCSRISKGSLLLHNLCMFYHLRFGPGSGSIWLNEVNCNGTEYFIQDCQNLGWGVARCTHQEDAGVVCQRKCWSICVSLSVCPFCPLSQKDYSHIHNTNAHTHTLCESGGGQTCSHDSNRDSGGERTRSHDSN